MHDWRTELTGEHQALIVQEVIRRRNSLRPSESPLVCELCTRYNNGKGSPGNPRCFIKRTGRKPERDGYCGGYAPTDEAAQMISTFIEKHTSSLAA